MHRAFRTVILIFWSLCSQLIIGAQPSLEVVTNQSETHVNFDNLIIRRWKPQVRVTYDYYPFGLTWENPKLPGTEEGLHDHNYQDKEYQFSEFSDGRGLELHDFHARMYDATTGRWLVPDPAAQFANPYLAMGNNPVISVDPDGRFAHILIGAGVGGIINWIAHGARFDQEGLEAFAIGALAGGLTAATGGAATALVGGAGAGGLAGGAVIGAFSATAGNVVLSEGNHLFLGDPRWSDGQYLIGAGMGALFGGVANGMTAKGQGNSFWSGQGARQDIYIPTWNEIQADVEINPISGEYIGDEIVNPTAIARGSTQLEGAVKSNYSRFVSKIPANSKASSSFQLLDDGNYLFQATSPGKVPGSSALYQKWVNPQGETFKMIKTTFAPDGSIIHVKLKF